MRAVDTNCLVRLIARDDPGQARIVDEFITNGIWVSHLVLAETIWVLDRSFGQPREGIIGIVETLFRNNDITLQEPDVVWLALQRYKESNVDFSDALILETARKAGTLPMGTFDKKLGKLEGTHLLS